MKNKIIKPLLAFVMAFTTFMGAFPYIFSPLVYAAGDAPNVSQVASLSGQWSQDPDVSMDGYNVSARRYRVVVDGINYEAYCADPMLRGPDNDGAVYELAGQANAQLKNALKNGFPINSEWSNPNVDDDERMAMPSVTPLLTTDSRTCEVMS